MRNAFLVAWREYFEHARTKGFWIGLLMFPVVIALSVQVPILLEKKGSPARHFILVDASEQFDAAIMAALAETDRSTNAEARVRRVYKRVPLPLETSLDLRNTNDLAAAIEQLRPYLRGERSAQFEGQPVKIDAAFIIPADATNLVSRPGASNASNLGAQYWSMNLADRGLRNLVENVINQEVRRREYLALGIDPKLYQQVERTRLPIVELNPRKEQGKEQVSKAEAVAQWAPVVFVYLLWVSIFTISQMLLSNTIEEKSNRIIEVLLSSLTPSEFVLGKLAGIAAVGLTMVGAWVGSFILMTSFTVGGQSPFAAELLAQIQGSHLLPAFAIYFFFGYLLYSGLILALGSVCNTLKEAQNYMAVITMLMMVPLLTMMFIARDPHGPIAKVMSWIPIYTPFVMMNRAAANPPLHELVGTMVLLIASAALVLWGAVKIFRIGILRTGQPPRIIEMLRWLRAD